MVNAGLAELAQYPRGFAQQSQGFGQGIGGGLSGLAAQQQSNAFNRQMTNGALGYHDGRRVEILPIETMRKRHGPRAKTFREELQHDVDQWLKNAL